MPCSGKRKAQQREAQDRTAIEEQSFDTPWKIVALAGRNHHGQPLYKAACPVCARVYEHTKHNLLKNQACRSCSNRRTAYKHGHGDSDLYYAWNGMWQRCTNPNHAYYARYGGRGITVDPRWASFEAFFEDMGPCPPGHHLDRRDNDGNYCKENCRYVLPTINAQNRSNARLITAFGKTQNLSVWAREVGISAPTLFLRLNRGMTPEEALTEPLGPTSARRKRRKA